MVWRRGANLSAAQPSETLDSCSLEMMFFKPWEKRCLVTRTRP